MSSGERLEGCKENKCPALRQWLWAWVNSALRKITSFSLSPESGGSRKAVEPDFSIRIFYAHCWSLLFYAYEGERSEPKEQPLELGLQLSRCLHQLTKSNASEKKGWCWCNTGGKNMLSKWISFYSVISVAEISGFFLILKNKLNTVKISPLNKHSTRDLIFFLNSADWFISEEINYFIWFMVLLRLISWYLHGPLKYVEHYKCSYPSNKNGSGIFLKARF